MHPAVRACPQQYQFWVWAVQAKASGRGQESVGALDEGAAVAGVVAVAISKNSLTLKRARLLVVLLLALVQ